MIPWHIFEELKGELVRIYIKDLPDPYCVLLGKIEEIREHIILFKDEEHDQLSYIPIKKIVLIKKT
ncbi:MAG: hypothetical protein EU535_01890 [Promethearchaeota archaeon]|nr:MAG: hypothetical protein EU535_01890 [Candidatus Lokiarchaeota archaeon]